MPPALRTTRRKAVFVVALTAICLLAACSSGKTKRTSSVGSTTSSTSANKVTATAFSPERDSVQGFNGVGIVVDLSFKAKDSSLTDNARPRINAAGKPGHNPDFPGLVATLTTTDQSLGGPPANLAGLFQVIGVSKQADGSSEVWATWTNSLPRFGVDTDTTLEAYLVDGVAPDLAPADRSTLRIVSNVVSVSFHVHGPPVAATTVPPSTTTSSTLLRRTTTTLRGVTQTTAFRTATTVRYVPQTTQATSYPPTTYTSDTSVP